MGAADAGPCRQALPVASHGDLAGEIGGCGAIRSGEDQAVVSRCGAARRHHCEPGARSAIDVYGGDLSNRRVGILAAHRRVRPHDRDESHPRPKPTGHARKPRSEGCGGRRRQSVGGDSRGEGFPPPSKGSERRLAELGGAVVDLVVIAVGHDREGGRRGFTGLAELLRSGRAVVVDVLAVGDELLAPRRSCTRCPRG